ncbi:MAG: BadF/BadG/BcrA/BcrD ATPase family protein [Terriglobia bacterium]|jgi:N-acetylglucosamine kinase-like BadF-type ATPase
MQMILGIDGGGTHTTAWLANERGKVLAKAVAGPSNPLKVGFEACAREILRAANAAVAAVSNRRGPVAPGFSPAGAGPSLRSGQALKAGATMQAIVVGLAGVDRPPVHARILAWLQRSIPARCHLLTSDAAIALHAAIGNEPGMMVISGTGSIAYAQDPDNNRVLRSGGWGIPYDDLGSGYEIGRQAIAAALRDHDGRGDHTVLGKMICQTLNLGDITEIIPKQLSPSEIAALFPVVLRAARRKDLRARLILDIASLELSELARALIERMDWRRREFTVVCAGGVFNASTSIREGFFSSVRHYARHARVMLLRKQPVEGALAMARRMADSK